MKPQAQEQDQGTRTASHTEMARATYRSVLEARARRNAAAAATRAMNRARNVLAARIAAPVMALAQFPLLDMAMASAPASDIFAALLLN